MGEYTYLVGLMVVCVIGTVAGLYYARKEARARDLKEGRPVR